MPMNYRATAEYYKQRAKRQRRHPSVRAHYAAEAKRYRTLAEIQEAAEGADQAVSDSEGKLSDSHPKRAPS